MVLWLGTFVTGMGFSMIMPFMSLYIDTLGTFNKQQLTFWSGITFSSTFLVTAIISPWWGKLADRKGRKLMLLRASAGMAIIIALMAFVTNVYELVALRFLEGVFSGFISNSTALIATSAPHDQSGYALGTLTTGSVSGTLLGPLVGGAIANVTNYRIPFLITATLLLIAFTLSLFFVHENFTPVQKDKQSSTKEVIKKLKYPHVILGMLVTTMIIQAGNYSISPILSLYVRQLMHGGHGVALASGFVASLPGVATLIAAPRFGVLGDKIGTVRILLIGLIFAALVYIPQAFVSNVWQLGFLRLLVGVSDAALLPQVQALLAKYSPQEATGRIFSYNQSFQAAGNVLGPMIGSVVSGSLGYSGVFLSTAVLIVINFGWVFYSTKGIRKLVKER